MSLCSHDLMVMSLSTLFNITHSAWFLDSKTSTHYHIIFAYSTHCIEAIVCSISYFNCPKYTYDCFFCWLIGGLRYVEFKI